MSNSLSRYSCNVCNLVACQYSFFNTCIVFCNIIYQSTCRKCITILIINSYSSLYFIILSCGRICLFRSFIKTILTFSKCIIFHVTRCILFSTLCRHKVSLTVFGVYIISNNIYFCSICIGIMISCRNLLSDLHTIFTGIVIISCNINLVFVGTFCQSLNLAILYIEKILCGNVCLFILEICILSCSGITLQQIGLIELGGLSNTINFSGQLIYFILDISSVILRHSSVSCLYSQLVHSLQHILNFVQGAFSGLYCADTILCVQGSLCQTSDLLSHLLTDGQACCVISCTVDLVSGRQLLGGLCLGCCG